MPSDDQLLILHLSDLHFGNHNRFADRDLKNLAKEFHKAIAHALKKLKISRRIDLVIVSGDIAETGKPREFAQGAEFLTVLAGELGREPQRFVFVPGNHDISWPHCEIEASKQKIEEFDDHELRRRLDAAKLTCYHDFLTKFYGSALQDGRGGCRSLGFDAWLHDFSDFRLSIAALNSCERESHRPQDHLGELRPAQAQALMNAWRTEPYTHWLKILVVHHNPFETTANNIESWLKWMREKKADMPLDLLERYTADVAGFKGAEVLIHVISDACPHLVLHGHHHDQGLPSMRRWKANGHAAVLSTGSWGLNDNQLPGDAPPSCQLILFAWGSSEKQLKAWPLIYDGRFRLEGEVLPGNYMLDAAIGSLYDEPLPLPVDWEQLAKPAQVPDELSPELESFLRAYRQRLKAYGSQWDLRPIGVTQAGGPGRPLDATLDHMYQPLRLAEGYDPEKTDQGQILDVEAILRRCENLPQPETKNKRRTHPLVIRGPAGSGKTTWMRYTFRRLLERNDAVPVMVLLRDLARFWQDSERKDADRSLDAFIDGWSAEQMGKGWEGCWREFLLFSTGPQHVLLVDGWDELGPLGRDFRERLLGFMSEHPHVLVLVTSRPYGEGRPSASDRFELVDIQPLSIADITEFAGRFFRICYRSEHESSQAEVERFVGALGRSPEAARLAQNALLLTMMLLISRSEQLPDKRHLLYEKCIYNLLTALPQRREEGGVLNLPEQWFPPDSEERKRRVAALAHSLQTAGYSHEGRVLIVKSWKEMANLLPEAWEPDLRDGFLSWLTGPSGLLTERADGTLVFSHLSFQEYLTAWYLNANVVSEEQCVGEFCKLAKTNNWWETLLLWGGMIGGQSQERLDPILMALINEGVAGAALTGMLLADGLGTSKVFQDWLGAWFDNLAAEYSFGMDLCARAWKASRQEERKDRFFEALRLLGKRLNSWPSWERIDFFRNDMGIREALPSSETNAASAALVSALSEDSPNEAQAIAAGRVLAGGDPLWPGTVVGLLHIWPGQRRVVGLRLQGAVACGASGKEIAKMLCSASLASSSPQNIQSAQYLARHFARDLDRQLTRYWARFLAGDLARYWSRNLLDLWPGYWSPGLSLGLAWSWSRQWSRDWSRDRSREWSCNWTRDFARKLAGLSTNDYASNLAASCQIDGTPAWIEEFAMLELRSPGWAAARTRLAQIEESPEIEIRLLSETCRFSLNPRRMEEHLGDALQEASAGCLALWPALARHVARRATSDDRTLLNDYAAHPERCEPPLSWGLQYIVRGDVLLADGSTVTLDDLADQAGLPHLPYLEEMGEEIDLGPEFEK